MVSPTELSNMSNPLLTNVRVQGDLLQDHKQRIKDHTEDDQLMKLRSDAGIMKTVAPRQYFVPWTKRNWQHLMFLLHVENTLCLEMMNHPESKDGSAKIRRLVRYRK